MKIVILSKGPGNYSTRRLQEEAVNRGHSVEIVDYTKCFATIEKNNPIVNHEGKDLSDVDVIIPRIGSSYTRYGSAIVRQFEMRGVYTTTNSIALVRSRDKLRSLQLLSRTGVGIPKSVFSRGVTDNLDDLIEDLGGTPIVIKLASGTHGNGVVLAETKKSTKSVLQAFYVMDDDGTNILLQEFIGEAEGEDIRAFVVGGKVIASMKRKGIDDDFRSNLHQGGSGTSVRLTDEERKTAQKAAKAMGLSICGVDMIRSKRGPLVLEVNASPGFGIEKVTGRNVAAQIIEHIEQNSKGKRRRDRVGA